MPIPPELCAGDYDGDPAFRSRFHRWLSALWHEKDQLISYVLAGKRFGHDAEALAQRNTVP